MEQDRELDELLSEARQLLDEASEPTPAPDASEVKIDYEKFYGEVPPEPAPRPLTAYEQSRPAYQTAKREQYEREREQERLAREQQTAAPEPVKKPKRPHKKPKPGLLIAFAAVLLIAAAVLLLPKQPSAGEVRGERIPGCSTILIAGTDEGGYRTDSMVLLRVSRETKSMELVSLPRDTLIYCTYTVPKLNSAYGYGGGGAAGMEELINRVRELIGFPPDGYLVVSLETFEQLVDRMGGVRYTVPTDMHYSDPSQGLEIDLAAGEQKLNGNQAMQLMRFRSGYPSADLERMNVQRDFLTAAVHDWVSVGGLLRLPGALSLLANNAVSDMNWRNFLWLAQSVLLCRQSVGTATLPGTPKMIAGGSYYVLDAQGVADTVNEKCNPYRKGVSVSELSIRTG